MQRAADHSPLADLALALEEIDALSIAHLGRDRDTPVDADALAMRAAVSRATVCLRKIQFWLLPATRVSPAGQRTIVAFRRPRQPGEPFSLPE